MSSGAESQGIVGSPQSDQHRDAEDDMVVDEEVESDSEMVDGSRREQDNSSSDCSVLSDGLKEEMNALKRKYKAGKDAARKKAKSVARAKDKKVGIGQCSFFCMLTSSQVEKTALRLAVDARSHKFPSVTKDVVLRAGAKTKSVTIRIDYLYRLTCNRAKSKEDEIGGISKSFTHVSKKQPLSTSANTVSKSQDFDTPAPGVFDQEESKPNLAASRQALISYVCHPLNCVR